MEKGEEELYYEGEKIKKKRLFSFTKLNRFFIFPFLSPIFIFIRDYIIGLAKIKNDGIKTTFQYEVMDGFMHSVCGLFYFIYCFRMRPQKIKNEENESQRETQRLTALVEKNNKENIKHKNWKIFGLILVIGLSYTVYISNSKILSKKYTVFEIRIYHLVFNTIFCKLILKYTVFRHQLFSLILACIGWVFISIPIFEKLNISDIIPNIIFFFGAIFYPLYLVFFKFIIENYYLSVFLNMFFIGVFLLIISIIGLMSYSLINCSNLTYLKEIFDIAENNYLFLIAIFFGTIVKVIFCLIIYYFTPNIFVLTNVISSIINWIFNLVTKKKEETVINIVFQSIGYFIILISTLIYNEFIIFNFFGLNRNTTKDINERIALEEIRLNSDKIDKDDDDDTDSDFYFEVGEKDEYIVTKTVNSSKKNLHKVNKK